MNQHPDCCGRVVIRADYVAAFEALEQHPPADRAAWALARVLVYDACPACGWWAGSPTALLATIAAADDPSPDAWRHLRRHGWLFPRTAGAEGTPDADLPTELDLVLPPCADPACHCARCRLVPATVTDLDQYARARHDRATTEHREAL